MLERVKRRSPWEAHGSVVVDYNCRAHGTLSGTAPDLTYTPKPGFSGTDSFTFKANDGKLDSNVATVSLTAETGG